MFPQRFEVEAVDSVVLTDYYYEEVVFNYYPDFVYGDSNVTFTLVETDEFEEDFSNEAVEAKIIVGEQDWFGENDFDVELFISELSRLALESITTAKITADFDKNGFISDQKVNYQGAIALEALEYIFDDYDPDEIFMEMGIDVSQKTPEEILKEAFEIVFENSDMDFTLNTNLQSEVFWFELESELNDDWMSSDSFFNFSNDLVIYNEDLEIDEPLMEVSKLEIVFNFPYPLKKVVSPLDFETSGNSVSLELLKNSKVADTNLIVEMHNTQNLDEEEENGLMEWSYRHFGEFIDIFPGERKTKFYLFAGLVLFITLKLLGGRRN